VKKKVKVYQAEKEVANEQEDTNHIPIRDEVITVKELSTRSLTGEGLRSTDYLTVPCCCCSERGHAMIERRYTKEGGIIQKARCPYLSDLRILETTTTREGDMLIFDIKSGVLAMAHEYDFRLALNTWNDMRMNGMVRKAPRWKLDKFEATLKEQCEWGKNGIVKEEPTPTAEEGVLIIKEVTTNLTVGKGRRDTDYYARPCQCCGEKGHSLLRSRHTKKTMTMEAMCPYITNPQIRTAVLARIGEVFVYEIRATVLAKLFRYNYVAAQCFLTEIVQNGPISMQQISQGDLGVFKRYLKEYCLEKRGEALWKELRGVPCRGCGSPFHGLLEYDHKVGKHRYKCPCMIQDGENSIEWYEDRRTRYQLCPLRLAREYRYDEKRVVTALNRHTERGTGRFMKPESLTLLRDRALLVCRGWSDRTLGGIPHQKEYTTRIIGIEGWERPEQKVNPLMRGSHYEKQSEKTVREDMKSGDRSLAIMALGILLALLLYTSKLLMMPLTTEVVLHANPKQHQEPGQMG